MKANNENTESWEQELRCMLSSHVSEAPAGLWESIERDVRIKERPRHAYHMRRWAAVAAMLVLLVSIGEFSWQRYFGRDTLTKQGLVAVKADKKELYTQAVKSDPQVDYTEHIRHKVTGGMPVRKNETCTCNADADVYTADTKADVFAEENAQVEVVADATDGSNVVRKTGLYNESCNNLLADNSYQMNSKHSSRKHSLNVSLSASGIPAEGSSVQSVSVISSDPGTGLFIGSDGVLKEGIIQQDAYEHHYPLKVGLSLDWQLTERLSAETGLNYTYLRSTVTKLGSGQNAPVTSTVNYLGIPASLSYQIWQSGGYSVYSGIGGEVAKSLKGEQWQCSAMLSLGVQYDVSKICGIYLQPSIDYYFDNHSAVKTYYSEHPLMPSLQVGLRFSIK